MTLKKFTAELLISKGIEQKVPEQVIPDESLTTALNVDFSKVGAARKRQGFRPNSNLVLGAGILDEARRLGSRKGREALCVTETITQLGSAAGIGNAGDTVYSYSEQAERWVPRGKMPRPNLDVLWKSGLVSSDEMIGPTPGFSFVTGGIQNYVCIAYRLRAQSDNSGVIRVVVLDVGGDVGTPLREGATTIIDTVLDPGTTLLGDPVGWVTAGDKVWLVISSVTASEAYAFRFADLTFDAVPTSTGPTAHAVSGDGSSIFVLHRQPGSDPDYALRKYTADMSLVDSATDVGAAMGTWEGAIDARSGVYIDVVRHNTTTGDVYVSRFTYALTQVRESTYVTTGTAGTAGTMRGNVQICTVTGQNALILWADQDTSNVSTSSTSLAVGLVRMLDGAVLGYFLHQALVPYAQPFLIDGRCFFVAMHSTGLIQYSTPFDLRGSGSGPEESFMCFQVPLDNMNPYNVPLAVAQWRYGRAQASFRSAAGATVGTYWAHGRTVYQSGSGIYVLTNVQSDAGQSTVKNLPLPELIRLEFGDAVHRWRSEDFHDCAFFAGGVLSTYDGDRTYEAATTLHAPVIVNGGTAAGGSLTAERWRMQLAALYTDANGRECWSPPSRIVDVVPAGANLTMFVNFIPPRLSMKPDLGNQFTGRLQIFCFVASASSNEFVAGAAPQLIDPLGLDTLQFVIATPPPNDSVKMYTAGFELDNWPPPPCRSIAAHNGRLFVIGDDDGQVWYSKPTRSDRCVEFALAQVIPVTGRGTALASIGDRLVIFTNKAIYAIQGDGPDVTGTPPDAFSRPLLISPDYGCVEYCAAGRTPLGVVFRGEQGFYLLTQGFSVDYIGGSVEDITSAWESTRAIVHDQEMSCCRIIGWTGTESQELCFWYDTKRWSLNSLATSDDYSVIDAMVMGSNLLEATTDRSVAVVSRYRLGSRALSPDYQDYDNDYDQVIQTAWISFNHAGTLKRFYRALVLLRPFGDECLVKVEVFKNWEDTPSSDREFVVSAGDTDVRTLRVHLKEQKIKAAKMRVTITSSGRGVELLKVGFEMGMKQMAVKEKREWSQ